MHFETHCLTVNMRARLSHGSNEYTEWMLKVGNGEILTDSDAKIAIPAHMICQSVHEMLEWLYGSCWNPDCAQNVRMGMLAGRAILACKNEMVDEINISVSRKFCGSEITMHSADTLISQEGDNLHIPVEYLTRSQCRVYRLTN